MTYVDYKFNRINAYIIKKKKTEQEDIRIGYAITKKRRMK